MDKMKFNELFRQRKPIIGMIHLAGDNSEEKVKRAIQELTIYEGEGINGAIIEDYHGTPEDVLKTLEEALAEGFDLVLGVNILRNPYSGFKISYDFGIHFIQFDSVQTPDLDLNLYDRLRRKYPQIGILGGIGFKYTSSTGNPLEVDLIEGKSRSDVIVTTGEGTGVETPLDKLREYKRLLGDFPLIVGAGVNLDNVYNQLSVANGAIIGSYFKPNRNTQLPVERKKVCDLIDVVRDVRK